MTSAIATSSWPKVRVLDDALIMKAREILLRRWYYVRQYWSSPSPSLPNDLFSTFTFHIMSSHSSTVTGRPRPKIWWSNSIFFLAVHIAAAIGLYFKPFFSVPRATVLLFFFSWQLADFGWVVRSSSPIICPANLSHFLEYHRWIPPFIFSSCISSQFRCQNHPRCAGFGWLSRIYKGAFDYSFPETDIDVYRQWW